MATLNEFANEMAQLSRQFGKNLENALEQAANRAGEVLVLTTPVVTGEARAGWHASIGAAVNGPRHLRDKRGQPTIDKIKRVTRRYRAGQTLFITNGVPYIVILNDKRDMVGRAERAAVSLLSKFKFIP